jgi:hypothetical protein
MWHSRPPRLERIWRWGAVLQIPDTAKSVSFTSIPGRGRIDEAESIAGFVPGASPQASSSLEIRIHAPLLDIPREIIDIETTDTQVPTPGSGSPAGEVPHGRDRLIIQVTLDIVSQRLGGLIPLASQGRFCFTLMAPLASMQRSHFGEFHR